MADADTKSLPHYYVEVTPISSQPEIKYELLKKATADALNKFQTDCSANLPAEFTKYLNALMGEIDSTHKAHEMHVEKASATVPTEQNPKTVVLDIEVNKQNIKKQFNIIETSADGNCLFSTLLQLLKTINKNDKNENLDVATIRTQIVKKVLEKNSQTNPTSNTTEYNLVDMLRDNLNFESNNNDITKATDNNEKKNKKVTGGVRISGNKILFIDRVVTVTDDKYVSEDNSKNYETTMKTSGTYGTEVEIIGAVLLYKISICVCIKNSNGYKFQYYIYKDDDMVTGLDSNSSLPDKIQFIYNTNNNHYQYLKEVN